VSSEAEQMEIYDEGGVDALLVEIYETAGSNLHGNQRERLHKSRTSKNNNMILIVLTSILPAADAK